MSQVNADADRGSNANGGSDDYSWRLFILRVLAIYLQVR